MNGMVPESRAVYTAPFPEGAGISDLWTRSGRPAMSGLTVSGANPHLGAMMAKKAPPSLVKDPSGAPPDDRVVIKYPKAGLTESVLM